MRNQSANIYKIVAVVVDLTALVVLFALVGWWRFEDLRISNPEYYNYYLQLLVLTLVSWFSVASWSGSFSYSAGLEQRNITASVLKAAMLQFAILAIIVVGLKGYYYSRIFLGVFFSSFYICALLARWILVLAIRAQMARGRWNNQYFLIGMHETARAWVQLTAKRPELGWMLVGQCLDQSEATPELLERADEVICAADPSGQTYKWGQEWAEKHGKRFRYLPNMGMAHAGQMHMEMFEGIPIFSRRKEPLSQLYPALIKRAVDLVGSILLLVLVMSWLFPLLSLLLWFSGCWNPVFIQVRSGMGTKPFKVLKFRTMNNQGQSNALQLWLRKTGLDELLQLLNVFAGNMSLVGPRPHTAQDDALYAGLVSGYKVRHWAKPGMTGLAQVRGLRGGTESAQALEERIRADVYYIENWSLLLDLRIVIETLLRTLFYPSSLHA